MEPSVYGLIFLIVVILIGSACCSGVEAAFLAVNSIRILELASKQKISDTEVKEALSNISTSTEFQSISECDLIIEAIPEIPDLKFKTFSELDEICKDI